MRVGLQSALSDGIKILSKSGIPTANLDARVILSYVTGLDQVVLFTHPDREIDSQTVNHFYSLLRRREKKEPVAYLTRHREFWGRSFQVSRGVFIPRPDTETLIEGVLSQVSGKIRIHDECSGTGCIAITLACELPHAKVSAGDISTKALHIIRLNNTQHGSPLYAIDYSCSLSSLSEPVDCITANPPYLTHEEMHHRAPYESAAALHGGRDGLFFIRELTKNASTLLNPKGILALEIGHTQEDQVRSIFTKHKFGKLKTFHDLQGHPRIIIGTYDV